MENTVKMIVAKNLIELRKRKNFTQGELAEMLNYSDKTISKWENGDSLPDISVLASLAEIYGITLDDLIHENAAEKVADKAEEKKALERYNQWIILSLSV
ncbi:MAG: helix-turn-helix domain-containing protein, partial [Christensenellaceae bacterium]